MCRDAEARANRHGTKAHFWWRGERTTVAPNLPTMTLPGLELRLMNTLYRVSDKSVPETMVK